MGRLRPCIVGSDAFQMATKKSRHLQDAKRSRAERRRLRELGLISKHVDLRKKPTKAQLKTIEKYRDLLTGKAKVIEVPKGRAREFKGFVRKGRKVIVPRQKGETIKFEKKSGRIVATKKGRKRIIHTKGKIGKPAKGKKFFYSVPFANGATITFDSRAELANFMANYATYKNWRQYLEIIEVDDDGYSPDDDE